MLVGKEAYEAGHRIENFDGTNLYWKTKNINRFSPEYYELLQRVYAARFEQDLPFKTALRRSADKKLMHTIGKNDKKETILAVDEFTGLLTELQKEFKNE